MRICIGPKDSEQLRVILGIVIIIGTGYSDPGIEISEEFKVIEVSGYTGQNSQYPCDEHRLFHTLTHETNEYQWYILPLRDGEEWAGERMWWRTKCEEGRMWSVGEGNWLKKCSWPMDMTTRNVSVPGFSKSSFGVPRYFFSSLVVPKRVFYAIYRNKQKSLLGTNKELKRNSKERRKNFSGTREPRHP